MWTNLGCCCFFLGMYPEAAEAARKGRNLAFIDISFEISIQLALLYTASFVLSNPASIELNCCCLDFVCYFILFCFVLSRPCQQITEPPLVSSCFVLFYPGPASRLQNRLLFHLAHKFNDEALLMQYHKSLQDVIEDQLSLASIHYLRSHYQEAIDIYKRILLDNRLVRSVATRGIVVSPNPLSL